MLKFVFFMFDPENGGFVDKDEIRHFIYAINATKDNSTIEQGLQYLEDNDDGDGQFEFYQIKDMHFRFQGLMYPAFRLIVQMRRASFGERWWETKGFHRFDARIYEKLQAERAALALSKKNAKDAEMANEDLVKRRMGITYYLTPWMRKNVRNQIARIAAINTELEKKETEGD